MTEAPRIAEGLERARTLARQGQDEAAKQAYIEVLRQDPRNFSALNELATLAWSGGYRSAARTAYTPAVAPHSDNVVARVNLGNLLREEQDVAGARAQYEAALALDPELHEAHQGMAWVLGELGLDAAADSPGGRWSRSPIAARGTACPSCCWSRRAAATFLPGCGSTTVASPFMRSMRTTTIRSNR